MRSLSSLLLLTVVTGIVLALSPGSSMQAQGQGQGPQGQGVAVGPPDWVDSVRHDTSRPLREIDPTPAVSSREDFDVKQPGRGGSTNQPDGATQTLTVAPLAATSGTSFDGIGEGNSQFAYNVNVAPPDTTGEAGLTQYVQWANTSFAIFDKATGAKVYGPAGGNTIFQGFGGDCEARNDGDPIVQYDQLADRWIMTQFAIRSGNYLQCVAISQTSDATGAWYRYAFSYADMPDYPKLAVWPDAYYITFNMFAGGSSFTGGRVCAYDRSKMLQGLVATQVCFQSTSYWSFLASDLEGKTLPAPGTPNYVLTTIGGLNLFKFTVNFTNPGSSTFVGPISVPVAGYTAACSQNCIPQPGTTQTLDALGDRLMYRLSYRNLGTREALVVNHSVIANGLTAIRWYELNIGGGTPSVRQQGTYAPADGQHRWMGSIAMDKNGNIAVGYSIGSAAMKPSIRFAGRESGDPLNTLSNETDLYGGTGSQLASLSRWGDYSTMSIDPVDDCTFWYTTEYLKVDGTFNWSTRVASFKFSSCAAPAATFTLGAAPSTQTVVQGQSTTFNETVTAQNGYAGTGTYSVSGLPTGATGTFAPTGYSNGNGSSTLTVATLGSTPVGTYTLTITAADNAGTPTQTKTVTLTVVAPPTFTLGASPATQTVVQGQGTSFTATVTAQNRYTGTGTFAVTGLPAGATGTFNPTGYSNGNGSSTLTVATLGSTPVGTYTLTITAADNAGTPTQTKTVTLTVVAPPTFTLGASPATQTVVQGQGTSFTATVTAQNNYTGTGTFAVTGLPAGATGTFNPDGLQQRQRVVDADGGDARQHAGRHVHADDHGGRQRGHPDADEDGDADRRAAANVHTRRLAGDADGGAGPGDVIHRDGDRAEWVHRHGHLHGHGPARGRDGHVQSHGLQQRQRDVDADDHDRRCCRGHISAHDYGDRQRRRHDAIGQRVRSPSCCRRRSRSAPRRRRRRWCRARARRSPRP